jgi:hypothetical protein
VVEGESPGFPSERLAEGGMKPSVGSKGDSYDNALAETIIGLFKTEVIHRRGPWRHVASVEYATLEWVDWYNNRRLLQPIGDVPSAEKELEYLSPSDGVGPRRLTQTNRSPGNPGGFNMGGRQFAFTRVAVQCDVPTGPVPGVAQDQRIGDARRGGR